MENSKAEAFLATAQAFQLGNLPTEQRHPETTSLADLSRTNIPKALQILHKIDLDAVEAITQKVPEINQLAAAMKETLATKGRIFFYGCGATGRLALSLEYLWRLQHKNNQVLGFMSGGDLALVHSIETFEDHPEYGARQLKEIGFKANDLLVSCTEGGETPSVIGATEEATRRSRRKPWFLYCNPNQELQNIERSHRVLENPAIEKICLYVGPMSLSGSTRLQATTVLQLAAGCALFNLKPQDFARELQRQNYNFLTPFIEAESAAYQNKEFLLYETKAYAITILTDTTERSPTFSLPGFENQKEKGKPPALAYLTITGAKTSQDAWKKLLLRQPKPLEWKVLQGIAGKKRLLGFDFSQKVKAARKKILKDKKQHLFRIHKKAQAMEFSLGKHRHQIPVKNLPPLFEHLLLKGFLNAHSLLVMGRLGRFESNVMTWVRPSNNKLIDRSIRYIKFLLEKDGIKPPAYEIVARHLFQEVENLPEGESVVLRTVARLKG